MELGEAIVKEVSFKLSKMEGELTLKPFSLRDEAWLRETFKDDELVKIFEELDQPENIYKLMRIVYRQLTDESKLRIVNSITPFEIDENGEKKEIKANAPKKLEYVITGANELVKVCQSLLEVRGLSTPKSDESKKKKVTKKKKTGQD